MSNPIKDLTRKEWMLWLGSLCIVILSNTLTENMDILTLVAACVGITSLIFCRKRKRMRADFNGGVQRSVRHHFMEIPLLG